jgi:hypothetical protein
MSKAQLQVFKFSSLQVCKPRSHDIAHNFIFDIIATSFLILDNSTKLFLKFLACCKVTAM